MTARRRALAAALATCAGALVSGCGNTRAPDLFLLQRSGSIPGARLSLLVRDDGFVRCNRGRHRRLPDPLLLDARSIARDLDKKAPAALAPGPRSVLSYRVKLPDGSVRFSDSSRGQSKAMFQAQEFARQVAQRVCGLAR